MASETKRATKEDFEAAVGTVSGLNFRDLDLRLSSVPESAVFENCDFSKAILSNLDLSGLEFRQCLFQGADLSSSVLLGATFAEKCILTDSVLKRSDATGANFASSDMSSVDASGATFLNADFTDVKTERAIFDRADLSNAIGFAPDRTQVAGTVFLGPRTWTGWQVDGWTYLHAEYTGLKLFLSILPPLIFVLSLLAKAYTSVAVGAYQAQLNLGGLCGKEGQLCSEVQLWQIVFGFREGPWAVFFIFFSITYNVSRFLLTLRVSHFSRLESRTRITPKLQGLDGYGVLRKVSTIVWCAKWIMLLLFASNMASLLSQTVVLPN